MPNLDLKNKTLKSNAKNSASKTAQSTKNSVSKISQSTAKPSTKSNTKPKELKAQRHEPLKIGVIIPIYNVAKYLRECLDSVLDQSYQNFEVVLVNDGSTDSMSLQIALSYTKNDARFILIDKQNGGQASARNAGIAYFAGELALQSIDNRATERESSGGVETLSRFKIKGENPHKINAVYASAEFIKAHFAVNLSENSTRNLGENSMTNSALNSSENSTQNSTINPAKIDYLIFLDSDDFWEENCLKECVDMALNSGNLGENSNENSTQNSTLNLNENSTQNSANFGKNSTLNSSQNSTQNSANFGKNSSQKLVDCHEFADANSRNDGVANSTLNSSENPTQNSSQNPAPSTTNSSLPDIVWFEWKCVYDGTKKESHDGKTGMQMFGFTKSREITAQQWFEAGVKNNMPYFSCLWDKFINFDYLKHINFRDCNGINYQDVPSSIILFAQAKRIITLPKHLHCYRVRRNSVTSFESRKKTAANFPPFLQPLLREFSDPNVAWWGYFHHYCWAVIALKIDEFCDSLNADFGGAIKRQFLPHCVREAVGVFGVDKDPFEIQPKLLKLLASLDKMLLPRKCPPLPKSRKFRHLCFKRPFLFRIYLKFRKIYEWQKGLERRFRSWMRNKA